MTFVNVVNPPLDDVLEHHGVKGQKWGVTRTKPTSGQIQDARVRVGVHARALDRQQEKLILAKGKTAMDREAKKLNSMYASFLKNPDRATSLRLTRGEKTALAIMAVGLPGVGTAAAATIAGTRVLARRGAERQAGQR